MICLLIYDTYRSSVLLSIITLFFYIAPVFLSIFLLAKKAINTKTKKILGIALIVYSVILFLLLFGDSVSVRNDLTGKVTCDFRPLTIYYIRTYAKTVIS